MSEQTRPDGNPAEQPERPMTGDMRTPSPEPGHPGPGHPEPGHPGPAAIAQAEAPLAHAPAGIPQEGPADVRGAHRYGVPGVPMNRGHPFYVGFMGAVGVLVAYWLLGLVGQLTSVLTLMLVAMFLALGLDPLVVGLQRRGMKRGWAVAVIVLSVIAMFVGFVAAIAPTLVTQAGEFSKQLPDLLTSFERSSLVTWLDQRYGLISSVTTEIQKKLTTGNTAVQLFGGVFGAGKAVVSGAFSAFTVLVLTLYFLASRQAMTEAAYRMVPASRRDRVRLLGDEITRRIGAYIAGQVAVATMNGVLTYIMLTILGLNYRLVLSISVGILGLIPLVGATLGAAVVILVALFDSWQLAVIVLVYYVIYQQVENYLISPRIMSRTVSVPGSVAVIAALAGGTLLGVLGALVAIPVAAGVLLIVQEVAIPRQAHN